MLTEAIRTFDKLGSIGKSAILRPRRVKRPSSSSAERAYSSSKAVSIVFVGGGS